MAPSRKPLERRRFPPPDELEEMRRELSGEGFTLTIGRGGYWYARSLDGLETYADSDARRAACLAWAAIYHREMETEDEERFRKLTDALKRHSRKGK